MEKRNLFQKIFGALKKDRSYPLWRGLGNYTPIFTPFGRNAYTSDTVRATIHAIASSAAKLKPKHIRRTDGGVEHVGGHLEKLLTIRPNEYMNAYDFIYKVVTNLYIQNNAFVWPKREGSAVVGFYPIPLNNLILLQAPDNELWCQFRFAAGSMVTLPYVELIHLRRHFNEDDIFGESNTKPLLPTLELINTTNQGIANAVKSSAKLRGILKFTQTMMKPEDLEKQRQEFQKNYLSAANDGGIAALDAKAEYTPLNNDPKLINGPQMQLIEDKVYRYFNVSRAIVQNDYDEEKWNAFYEGVLEPLAVQMSLEFTSRLFSDKSQGRGNEIIFEANRLQYASVRSKIEIAKQLVPMGLFELDEIREIFNLAPLPDGEGRKRIISLNYVDANKANQYQLGQEGDGGGGSGDGQGDPDSGTEGD